MELPHGDDFKRNDLRPLAFRFCQRGRGGFLEFAADVAGVAFGEVGALHHQDVGDAFDQINPRLRAPAPPCP